MIKTVGIIMLIFGAIAVPVSLGIFLETLSSWWYDASYQILLAYEVCLASLMLAFGIYGLANAYKIEKAQSIIGMGIALCVMRVIDLIAAISILYYVETSIILGVILGLTLPILYIVGGSMSKSDTRKPY